jgi:hypothetical protein
MSADALSDVLRTVRLTGAAFFDIVATAPWVAEQPPRENILPKILPGAGHLIAYHVVTEGRCFTNLIGEEPVEVEAGEVIVFTKGDQHVLSSSPGMRADPGAPSAHDAVPGSQLPFLINLGGDDGPASARFVCGFLACDAQPFNPLLDNLPPIIKTAVPQGGDQGWLGQFIRVAMMESADKRAGGESVLAKLSELMFIEVVRRHLEALPPEQAGWLAGLRDPFVGKALSLMHAKPAHNWTIEDLAKDVGLSRSVLAERFADLVGMPPMHYLAKWRMQIASGSSPAAPPILQRSPPRSAMAPKPRSAAPSRKWWGCPPRHGAAAPLSLWTARVRCQAEMRSPGRLVDRGFPTKGVIAGFVITVGEDGFVLAQAPAVSRRVVKVKTEGARAASQGPGAALVRLPDHPGLGRELGTRIGEHVGDVGGVRARVVEAAWIETHVLVDERDAVVPLERVLGQRLELGGELGDRAVEAGDLLLRAALAAIGGRCRSRVKRPSGAERRKSDEETEAHSHLGSLLPNSASSRSQSRVRC